MADWATTTWYERFKDFQSLLGFGGVILTLWWNAKLKRDEHERVISHEKRTLIAALKAELTANQTNYKRCLESMEERPNSSAIFFATVVRDVFNKSIEQIGLLNENDAARLIRTYQNLGVYPEFIKDAILQDLRQRDGKNSKVNSIGDGGAIIIEPLHFEKVKRHTTSAVAFLGKEIERLSK